MIIPFGNGYKKVVQLGQCACGAHVCPICKKEQPQQLEKCSYATWKCEDMNGKEIFAPVLQRCTVVIAYNSQSRNDGAQDCLELSVGERIVVLINNKETALRAWCFGLKEDGKEGWFPRSHVHFDTHDDRDQHVLVGSRKWRDDLATNNCNCEVDFDSLLATNEAFCIWQRCL